MAKRYFKHYENADASEFVQKVIKKFGLVGYAHWNLLLELMVGKYDGKSILIRLTVQEIASKLRIKPARVHSVIAQFSGLNEDQVITKLESSHNRDNFDGFIIIIRAHILADLQAKDFGRSRTGRASVAPRLKIEDNKIKDIMSEATEKTSGVTFHLLGALQKEERTHPQRLVFQLCSLLLKESSDAKIPKDLTTWIADAEKLYRIDKRDFEESVDVMEWTRANAFWQPNVRSISKFRSKYETLRAQMKREEEKGKLSDDQLLEKYGFGHLVGAQ